jgi:hypothetical protein
MLSSGDYLEYGSEPDFFLRISGGVGAKINRQRDNYHEGDAKRLCHRAVLLPCQASGKGNSSTSGTCYHDVNNS